MHHRPCPPNPQPNPSPPPVFFFIIRSSHSPWQCLTQSYHFARVFNGNYELRHSLMAQGFVAKVPNLNQQETLALAAALLFSFRLYTMYGGNALGVFDEDRLVVECHDFLVRAIRPRHGTPRAALTVQGHA